jgi:DNA-binding NtrC family response regulator
MAVCLSGEPETGRRLLSRVIHRLSPDSSPRPFVTVECGGRSGEEVDRELFGLAQSLEGHRRSGPAVRVTPDSALSRAHGGTMVLRDVADAPDRVQAKLARILRDGEALVGATRKVIPVTVRAMAIVEPSVDAAISEGRLRQDLFGRLNQIRIDVPPLRRRREDVPQLAAHFLHEACAARRVAPKAFSRSALRLLLALPWPGNASELKTMVDGLAEGVTGPVVQLDDLLERANLDGLATRFEPGVTLREAKARFERECIAAVILRHRGRMGEAARALGIQRTNLYRKVRQLKVTTAAGLGRR